MDMHQLAEFEELFGDRRETLALICLGVRGPLRWTEVSRAMSQQAKAPSVLAASPRRGRSRAAG